MKKYYVLICFVVVAFCGYASGNDEQKKDPESELNIHDNHNSGVMVDNHYDDAYFDALDVLASQDRTYAQDASARQPFHTHLPAWVKEFGIFVLLKYVSLSVKISKSFQTIKRKIITC